MLFWIKETPVWRAFTLYIINLVVLLNIILLLSNADRVIQLLNAVKMLARRLECALWASTLVCKLALHAGSCDLEFSKAFGLCIVSIYWLSLWKERYSTT